MIKEGIPIKIYLEMKVQKIKDAQSKKKKKKIPNNLTIFKIQISKSFKI